MLYTKIDNLCRKLLNLNILSFILLKIDVLRKSTSDYFEIETMNGHAI